MPLVPLQGGSLGVGQRAHFRQVCPPGGFLLGRQPGQVLGLRLVGRCFRGFCRGMRMLFGGLGAKRKRKNK